MLFPFLKPNLPEPDAWVGYLEEAYKQRYFSNFGPLATRLAGLMTKAYLQDGYNGVLCASNTAGLTASLQALSLAGKKVALPDFTFAATPQAVFSAGAEPVVCDVDPGTWELSAESLSAAFEKHPDIACVIHVRPFGLLRDIEPVRAICRDRGVPLVVDAAAGLGAPSDETRFGSPAGEIEVFSLHATKVFAIGEGGFIAAPEAMLKKIRAAMNFGFHTDRSYGEGQNAKLDEFRAAIGLAMLERMDEAVAGRRRHAEFYQGVFVRYPGLRVAERPGPTPWSNFPVVFDQEVTSGILGTFADNGIEVKKYYWPGVLKGYKGGRKLHAMPVPNSEHLQDRCACMPIYSDFFPETGSLLEERVEKAMGMIVE